MGTVAALARSECGAKRGRAGEGTFVDDVPEVRRALELLERGLPPHARRARAEYVLERAAQLDVYARVAREQVHGPADQARGGVTARKQYVEPAPEG